MTKDLWGVLFSLGFVCFVLGIATLCRALLGMGVEGTRKLVHIGVSGWAVLAVLFFQHPVYACIPPACFVAVNALSRRRGIIKAVERPGERGWGTVWYALALLVLTAVGFLLGLPQVLLCGALVMGLGDGLAAVVGMRWGVVPLRGKKTLEGSMAMFTASFVATLAVLAVYQPEAALAGALIVAWLCTLLEIYSGSLDNLAVPLGAGGLSLVIALFPGALPLLLCVSVTAGILTAALWAGALTKGGFWAAFTLGIALFLAGGWLSYAALVLFFVLGSGVSRVGARRKGFARGIHQRHGARTAWQVAANGLPALLFALLYQLTGSQVFLLAVLCAFAGACADTFSSELGMLSRRQPVTLLGLRPVAPGLSGGVTPLGLAGAALGALLMALLAIPFGAAGAALVFACGVICSLLDSLLGATLQAKYRLRSGGMTERQTVDGIALPLASGLRLVNNDVVNFTSILLCGVVCVAVLPL